MASMNTRLKIEKLDGNIVQKHGSSKQVELKQLGSKQVVFKQLGHKQVGFKQLGPGVSNDNTTVAQRRLEDKQLEEKTNTDCLVKKQEKVHLGIKVGANITITGVSEQEGAEGGPQFEVPARGKDAEYRLCLSVTPKVRIYQKSQENHQKQANTDTRTKERAKAGSQSQKKSTSSQPWSTEVKDKTQNIPFLSLKFPNA
ncbi:hypothetical protein Tco_1481849, partial [Tanacetum coccineum]